MRVLLFESVRELLLNVVKHAGVRKAYVDARYDKEGLLRLAVWDEGKGFDPATAKPAGFDGGFGLFSIRERLELLGGTMTIEAAPAQGTRVTLVALLPSAAEPAMPQPEAKSAPESTNARPASAIHIVIADDHSVVREGIVALLKQEPDIEIVGQAADGAEVIELARRLKPEVVLMDIGMPNVNGIEATKVLRQELPQVKVIGLTMFEEAEPARDMIEAGAVAYLHKSRAGSDLVATIRTVAAFPSKDTEDATRTRQRPFGK
jgi:CheY-like chemotaxis protein